MKHQQMRTKHRPIKNIKKAPSLPVKHVHVPFENREKFWDANEKKSNFSAEIDCGTQPFHTFLTTYIHGTRVIFVLIENHDFSHRINPKLVTDI